MSHYGFTQKMVNTFMKYKDENLQRAEEELSLLEDFSIRVVVYGTNGYPTLLSNCCDAPLVLYSLGGLNLAIGNEKWITITGTKSCSEISTLITNKLLEDISRYSPETVIVSGISDGVEKNILRTTVKNGLRCVVVSPKSLDKLQNDYASLFINEVLEAGGVVLTEYPFDTPYYPTCYKETNRIMAGISHATIITEAPLESNTLQTAYIAESYCRELFAFPGRATDHSYMGCNALIKSGKADMITEFSDVVHLMELDAQLNDITTIINEPPKMSSQERQIYDLLADGNPRSDEEIMSHCEIDSAKFNMLISLMELNDLIVSLRGRMYTKKL